MESGGIHLQRPWLFLSFKTLNMLFTLLEMKFFSLVFLVNSCYSSQFSSSLTSFLKHCLSFSPSQRGLVITNLFFSVFFHSCSNIYYVFTMRQFPCSYSLPHSLKTGVAKGSVLNPFPHFSLYTLLGPSHWLAWLQWSALFSWCHNSLAWSLVLYLYKFGYFVDTF